MVHEPRARLGRELAELLPGDIDKVFFALAVTGRSKILARYRSCHGATGTALQATGGFLRVPFRRAPGQWSRAALIDIAGLTQKFASLTMGSIPASGGTLAVAAASGS